MLDIKWIRDNIELFENALKARGVPLVTQELLNVDNEFRQILSKLQILQEQRNEKSRQIAAMLAQKAINEADQLKKEVSLLKDELSMLQAQRKEVEEERNKYLTSLPNIPLADVPIGVDETDNLEILCHGKIRNLDFEPKQHYELGENLGMMHFEKAAQIAGARFVVLSDELALLERALGQFMLDVHVKEHGYREVVVPTLVRSEAMYGTGQLPKFAEDLFKTTDDRWLISTSEISLTNLVREEILKQEQLPLRFTALSQCFRSEAGAAGRDTRGMLRQHQFSKVELVSITDADSSIEELERMTLCAEEILKRLEIPYRKMLLCTGDMGASARKTYDLEAWLPGQNSYREISSCSVCGDFQARRMDAKYRHSDNKEISFVHSLNGSGLAIGRTLIAVMENYQQRDGSIIVPEVLQPYMNNLTVIKKAKGLYR
ncbi:serine--tRNA ligase [Bartonella sp. DGB1]|uniref:serine--tRNA ligase n=1 Tax=Bartonella sp. DGB1 TaxID=3239807 RepID=UPI003524176F